MNLCFKHWKFQKSNYCNLSLGLLIIGILPFQINAQDSTKVHYELSVTGDFIKNMEGGITQDYAYIGLEDLSLQINLEKLGLWKGGELFLHGLNSHGRLPSQEITGDLQVFSNIESGHYTGLYEFWYRQRFGGFSFLVGQHDLNSEFVGTEYGGTFINSSFGIVPTISLNIPVSIYPMAAPAIIGNYIKENNFSIKLGIYDGDPGDSETNRYNIHPNINAHEGYLMIGEFEMLSLVNKKSECFKVGGYYHSGDFTSYKDTTKAIKGSYGFYVISDWVILSSFNKLHRYMGVFLQSSIAPPKMNQIQYFLGGGIYVNGILPQRFNDSFGAALAFARNGDSFKKIHPGTDWAEVALEFTYRFSIFDNSTIQPNMQYIINPGANNQLKDALVFLLRFNIELTN